MREVTSGLTGRPSPANNPASGGGRLLRQGATLVRMARHLGSALAVSVIVAPGLGLVDASPAMAEFQIQEAGIEKGEVEIEYRGAYHWGVPRTSDENENANDLVQSHEIELQMSITDWWLIQITGGFDQPASENLEGSTVEIETEFALIKRDGNGVAVSFQLSYEEALNRFPGSSNPNQFGFGPILELAKGPLLITLNPLLTRQIGTFAEQDGLGFEYGWRAEYDLNKRWGLGVEMFGEIEDLANAGPFEGQVHSMGPTLFVNLGGGADARDDDERNAEVDGDNDRQAGPPQIAFSMNVGVQFGLTDATSDAALKFQGSLSF